MHFRILLLLVAISLAMSSANAQLSGIYTVDPGQPAGPTNFLTVSEAANAINSSGISGPVTIHIADGYYNEQVVITLNATKTNGTSETNTVTFRAINDGMVTIGGDDLPNGNYVLRLVDPDHLRFIGITFDADVNNDGGTNGEVVEFFNNMDDVQFRKCHFKTIHNTTYAGANILESPSSGTYNRVVIDSTIFEGGQYQLHFNIANPSTPTGDSLTVTNSTFIDGNRPFQVETLHLVFEGNVVASPDYSDWIPVQATRLRSLSFRRNRISAYRRTVGLWGNVNSPAPTSAVVDNNVFVMDATDQQILYEAAVFSSFNTMTYVHNAVLSIGDFTYGLAILDLDDLTMANNTFDTGDKPTYRVEVSGTVITRNNILGTTGLVAKVNSTTYGDLTAMQSSGYELESVVANPIYRKLTPTDLYPTTYLADATGTSLFTTDYDIEGLIRADHSPVDPGAFATDSSLPIESIQVAATSYGDGTALITWTADGAASVSLERATTGDWATLDGLPSAGATRQSLSPGVNRFRITAIDEIGTKRHSEVIELFVQFIGLSLSEPYPNPARSIFHIGISSRIESKIDIGLFDVLGRRVLNVFEGTVADSERSILVPVDAIASGLYFVVAIDESGRRAVKPIVIRRP